MKTFREFINEDWYQHDDGNITWGKQGAGVVILCTSTNRILLAQRSTLVDQPNEWSIIFGGAIDEKEKPIIAAQREMKEELGFNGKINIINKPIHIYKNMNNTFTYYTFLVKIDKEFEPDLDWETTKDSAIWISNIKEIFNPIHFGTKNIIPILQKMKLLK